MIATRLCVVFFLMLSGCTLEALLPGAAGGGGDGDGDGNGSASESAEEGERVCVYHSTSSYYCSGWDGYDSSLECSPSSSLESCQRAHAGDTSCSDGCCFEWGSYGHTMFDGPCEVALAHANSVGTGGAALIADRCGVTSGNLTCDACMNVHCAPECTACANEPGCLLVIHCASGCETDSCVETCVEFYAAGYEVLRQLNAEDGCLAVNCLDECSW